MLRRLFTARGSKVPEATWVPPQEKTREPAQLGFLHATGAHAFERLSASEAAIPPRWIKVSDHSKRGLVFAVHPDTSAADVIDFAVAACEVLALVPTDDRWIAQVSTSSRL